MHYGTLKKDPTRDPHLENYPTPETSTETLKPFKLYDPKPSLPYTYDVLQACFAFMSASDQQQISGFRLRGNPKP